MQQEIRFATFNVLNLALPGLRFYDGIEPYTQEQYEAKVAWLARSLDRLDAGVIALQEVFSQQAVRDVMTRTQRYRDAQHVGFEPEAGKLTPSVALISRLPLAGPGAKHLDFPRGLSVPLPDMEPGMTRFTRPVLQVPVLLAPGLTLNVFVVHLKSKRPDYRNGDSENDPGSISAAVLRSMIRRGAEALGLRYLLSDFSAGRRLPLMVMGDFNDVADAVPTQLVLGSGRCLNGHDERLFECYRLQSRRDPLRDVGFTHVHDGNFETIDHVLVSEEFNPASPHALGEVLEVAYLNDHVTLRSPDASDHGAVLVRIRMSNA
ncbi:MAG: endonuclease/exonuclease/phosphatase family protein [Noviherbaspirillum sp.]